MEEKYHYKAFNLHFEIPFECEELVEIKEKNRLDKVLIEFGQTPTNLDEILNETVTFQANNKEYLINLKTVGKFYIVNGNKIVIEKKDDSITIEKIKQFLFGSVFSALLFQRGFLPLYASAIKTSKGAILFCGNSGSGKSTLLHEFLKRGYKKLSDGICATYYDKTRKKVMCVSSYPQSKLWQNSLDILAYKSEKLKQINEELKKFKFSTKKYFFDRRAIPVEKIVFLNIYHKDDVESYDIKEEERLTALASQIHRIYYLEGLETKKFNFITLVHLSKQVNMKFFIRPIKKDSLVTLANKIEEFIDE